MYLKIYDFTLRGFRITQNKQMKKYTKQNKQMI